VTSVTGFDGQPDDRRGACLAAGDPLGALKRIALRDNAPALALRGIAMAQLGDLVRAKALLKCAARAFGPKEAVARARCVVAEAEIALASRDLGWPAKALDAARTTLERTATRKRRIRAISAGPALPPDRAHRRRRAHARQAGRHAFSAGVANRSRTDRRRIDMRRLRIKAARAALGAGHGCCDRRRRPCLMAEVESALRKLNAPAARRIARARSDSFFLMRSKRCWASKAFVVAPAVMPWSRGPGDLAREASRVVHARTAARRSVAGER